MKTAIICAALALVLSCVSGHPPAPQSRIVGGEEASPDAAPFIVSLQWDTVQRRHHFCAAAILNEEYLLTAAHCIQALPQDSVIKAVAGKTNLFAAEDEHQQTRFIEHYTIHQNFSGGISGDDLALLRVSEAFEWTHSVQPIRLPRTKAVPTGKATVFGWGSTSEDFMPEFPDTLQLAQTIIVPYEQCEEVLGGEGATPLLPSNLCTGHEEGGISACNGDSGGPLVKTDEEGVNTLVGIVSWGFYPCGGPRSPSIYANVASYMDWIERNME